MPEDSRPNVPDTTPPAGVERRRTRLPQPDLTGYQRANAYPGASHLFVGHSYDTTLDGANEEQTRSRAEGIRGLFSKEIQYVPVQQALADERFQAVLTRFEHDLLSRLPHTSKVGTAIDSQGKLIAKAFTIWREERRKPRGES